MLFSYILTEDIGKLRLRIGDTVEGSGPRPPSGTSSNFSDVELQHFLDHEGSLGRALVLALETLATEWSIYTNITLGPRREEFAKIAEQFAKRAATARLQYGGGSTFSVGWDREDGYSEAADATTELS